MNEAEEIERYCDTNPKEKFCESKNFFVGVSIPWGQNRLMWDVEENKDYLSPDLLVRARGVELPLLKIEAKNKEEAVKEYRKQVPKTKDWRLVHGWEEA